MEQSKTTQAAFWWYRFRSKHKKNVKSLVVSTKGKSPDRFLIILPEHSTESDLAKRFIASMKNALGPKGADQMKILGTAIVGNLLDLTEFHDFILYSDDDLNRFGLPDKELISTCNKIEVDAILDLNQEFSPISATLCGEIVAPLKVGFYSDEGDGFYNIMVRRTGAELAESGFKEIFQILGMG